MFTVMDIKTAIPLHACVRLISNFSRVLAYLKSVEWKIFGHYLVGALPGFALGFFIFRELWKDLDLYDPFIKVVIGAYILMVTYRKKKKVSKEVPFSRFAILGLYSAPVSLLVGATGPILAPYFIRDDLKKETIVATKALCQSSVHLLKVIIFYFLFTMGAGEGEVNKYEDLMKPGVTLLCLLLAAVIGTVIGKKLMPKVSEAAFRKFYVVVLLIAGYKILIVDGIWGVIQTFVN
jgi:uncharacterized membrane protein YfcA